ncbi:MAG: magnesium transporter [Desulfuromonadaceae bacterium]|nr:magnesium transporter [Desulfuromonadaceae bacterium]
MDRKIHVLLDTVKRLLRRNAFPNLTNLLQKTHPADIAHLFRYLDFVDQQKLFSLIKDVNDAAEVLAEIEHSISAELLDELATEKAVEVLQAMSHDDSVDIIRNMPEEMADKILDLMQDERSHEIEQLMRYREDSAGGIMSTNYFSLNEELTVKQAIEALQEAKDAEMVFYVYVIDEYRHLVGVMSLRQLLTVPPNKVLRDIIGGDVISVHADADQEDVARWVAKYDILAIPVVDEQNKLLGIVTVDDVIDVLREEATEDIYKMVGASEDELLYGFRAFKVASLRLPWLLVNLLGGVVTGYLLWWFQATLQEVIALISFVPVITGMGGNIGGQSSTIVVRGFTTGRIDFSTLSQVFFKELRVGMIMGVVCGGVVGAIGWIWHGNIYLGLVVCLAMMISMTVAATMGVLAPAFFKRINIDPAIASSPFVQTANDITGILIYFSTATLFLKYLSPVAA